MHLLVKLSQAGQHAFVALRILVLKELHRTWHARLDVGILIRLADGKAQHGVRVFRQIQQIDQRRNVIQQRAENHAAKAE